MAKKATLKTVETAASVDEFLATVPDETRRADAKAVCKLMQKATGEKPKMWGPAIVGFGHQVLKYPSGRELDWMLIGFSPRKANTVLYLMDGYDRHQDHLKKLGKHKTGKACLYIDKLADIDLKVLTQMVEASVKQVKASAK